MEIVDLYSFATADTKSLMLRLSYFTRTKVLDLVFEKFLEISLPSSNNHRIIEKLHDSLECKKRANVYIFDSLEKRN